VATTASAVRGAIPLAVTAALAARAASVDPTVHAPSEATGASAATGRSVGLALRSDREDLAAPSAVHAHLADHAHSADRADRSVDLVVRSADRVVRSVDRVVRSADRVAASAEAGAWAVVVTSVAAAAIWAAAATAAVIASR